MVKSNEFKGATLAEAVKKATAAYRQPRRYDAKDQRRCNDLILGIDQLKQQAGRHADEAERYKVRQTR